MDIKLPSSGCEEHMIAENMELLEINDTVKFCVWQPGGSGESTGGDSDI